MSKQENSIPEAAVEAAAEVVWEMADAIQSHEYAVEIAHLALEAAAPFIAAKALEDAADAFEDLPVNKGATVSTGTSDWFELFPVQHIRDRAQDVRPAK